MNHKEIQENIGNRVTVNTYGDILMDSEVKRGGIVHNIEQDIRIIKLTRGGLVMLSVDGKLFNYPLPPKNIDLYEH